MCKLAIVYTWRKVQIKFCFHTRTWLSFSGKSELVWTGGKAEILNMKDQKELIRNFGSINFVLLDLTWIFSTRQFWIASKEA